MRKLVTSIILLLLSTPALPCSVSRDFKFPDISESASLAGAILVGTVEHLPEPSRPEGNQMFFVSRFRMKETVILRDAQYFKGCGPSRVEVTGYSSSSMCGIDAPEAGKRVIVFVCKHDKGWKLNRISAYAGQFDANEDNLRQLVDSVGDSLTCANEGFAFKTCKRRKPENTKRKMEIAPARPILVEPKPILVDQNRAIGKAPGGPVMQQPQSGASEDNTFRPIMLEPQPIPGKGLGDSDVAPGTFGLGPISQSSTRRNVKVSSKVTNRKTEQSTISARFPIIPKPVGIKLNQQNQLVSDVSKSIPKEFNPFISQLFNQ